MSGWFMCSHWLTKKWTSYDGSCDGLCWGIVHWFLGRSIGKTSIPSSCLPPWKKNNKWCLWTPTACGCRAAGIYIEHSGPHRTSNPHASFFSAGICASYNFYWRDNCSIASSGSGSNTPLPLLSPIALNKVEDTLSKQNGSCWRVFLVIKY